MRFCVAVASESCACCSAERAAAVASRAASTRTSKSTARRSAALQQAQDSLATATQSAQAPSFAPGVGNLMGAASFHDNYVFPVGGGPQP